jgi:signal transduction histidine kinase
MQVTHVACPASHRSEARPMSTEDPKKPGEPRARTDSSLKVERAKVDKSLGKKRAELEREADTAVRRARKHADEVVRHARDVVDRGPAESGEASAAQEREQADDVLRDERATADAALERERKERRRILDDFMTVEREATDEDLEGERGHADEALAAQQEMLGTVCHDLRSLLGGLSLSAQLLDEHAAEGEVGAKIRRFTATSQRLIARMSRLLNDLLDVSSLDAGKLSVRAEDTAIADIAREALDAFMPIATTRGVALEVAVEPPELRAAVDGGRILQILANLLSNAIKFTGKGGRVSLRAEGGRELRFTVRDTGIGIPAAELSGVFERFRQVREDRRGLGIGLHISRSIVELHGGKMWAESTPGQGSTFIFTVPLQEPQPGT